MTFECATTSLFKFILRIIFKWLMSLPLDFYSALLLKASNSPLGLRKINHRRNTFEISRIKLRERMLVPLLFK